MTGRWPVPFKHEYEGATAKLKYWGPVWYRKHFQTSTKDAGKKFSPDSGENVLAIRLESPPDSSRRYPGAGIYRNVWLLRTEPIHIAHWGTSITTPVVEPSLATTQMAVKVENETESDTTISLKNEIYEVDAGGAKGRLVATQAHESLSIKANSAISVESQIELQNPRLWSTLKPALYLAVTSIAKNGQLLDTYETPFGIRKIKFDAEKGFFLNGEHIRINGVCNHHDLGALAARFTI